MQKMDLFVCIKRIDQINHLNCISEVGIVDFEAKIMSKSKYLIDYLQVESHRFTDVMLFVENSIILLQRLIFLQD